MKGRNCPYGWMDEVNEMRPEAVPVQVHRLLPEDRDEAPLLEAPEEVPLGLSLVQDTLPGMSDDEMFWDPCLPGWGDFEYGEPDDIFKPGAV